ncbi:MAG: DDE-type integrase/transposase/recombinase [Paludibacteraceae bacterium]|nr:DDE-type integrase/transposase/recombinase [Paludibacteraceae bacterium]
MAIYLTFYFDVFTKEILTHQVADKRGSKWQYIKGLEEIVTRIKGLVLPVVLHTDQGSVYASMAYNELIKDTNIVRSMSRADKTTDNPVNEALNGWIKELMQDFKFAQCRTFEQVKTIIEQYVKYYNMQRPCYVINYNTPDAYRRKFYNGKLPKKNENRGV